MLIFRFVWLADVGPPVTTLYEHLDGSFSVARELTVLDAQALPPSIRAEWEAETGWSAGDGGRVSGRIGKAWREKDGEA